MVGGATGGFISGTGFGLQTGYYQGLEGSDLWNYALAQGGICALTGTISGALAPFGGGDWLLSTLAGAVEGAAVGGVYAALTGGNFWEGLAWGALLGGVGGFITSENVINLIEGYGFETNKVVLGNYLSSGNYTGAINFVKHRYGLEITGIDFVTPLMDIITQQRVKSILGQVGYQPPMDS